MDQAEFEQIRESIDSRIRERFSGAPIQRVEVLRYGDDPQIEPGEVLARVHLDVPDVEGLEAFHDAYRPALKEMHEHMRKVPGLRGLEFRATADADGENHRVIKIGVGTPHRGADGQLTPVMARLGAEDLETLDTLISVGIAGSRAEGLRWALARIRERPAYAQIRSHATEIDALKSQF
jgi:hypothetical protein